MTKVTPHAAYLTQMGPRAGLPNRRQWPVRFSQSLAGRHPGITIRHDCVDAWHDPLLHHVRWSGLQASIIASGSVGRDIKISTPSMPGKSVATRISAHPWAYGLFLSPAFSGFRAELLSLAAFEHLGKRRGKFCDSQKAQRGYGCGLAIGFCDQLPPIRFMWERF